MTRLRTLCIPLFHFFVAVLVVTTTQMASAHEAPEHSQQFVSAHTILNPDILRGPGYVIDNTVRIQGNRYLFHIRSDYGDVIALGFPMLELRLREHTAIQNALTLSKEPLVIRGIMESAKKTPAGAMTLLRDPVGSIKRIPKGVQGTIDSVVNPLERRAGSATRRELAAAIGADPETRNPILDKALDRIALRKGIGVAGTQIGASIALPGLSLLAINEDIRRQVSKQSPKQIADDVERQLRSFGVQSELATAFANSNIYTSTEKLKYMAMLRKIKNVGGLDILLRNAVDVKSEAELLSQIQHLDVLVKMHQQRPVKQIYSFHVPVVLLEEGHFVGIAAVDLIHDITTLSQYIADFREKVPGQRVALLVTGNVSSAAKKEIEGANIELLEIAQIVQKNRR